MTLCGECQQMGFTTLTVPCCGHCRGGERKVCDMCGGEFAHAPCSDKDGHTLCQPCNVALVDGPPEPARHRWWG